jgi:DNA-binding beta-propeller fold protein YncE
MPSLRTLSLALFSLIPAAPSLAATLLVLNKEDATLTFVDPASGKTTASVPVGAGPHEVEVSPDGKVAVVSNYGARTPGNSLSIVDVPARKERQRVDLGALQRPHGLAIPGTRTAYFTSEVGRGIGTLDLATGRYEWKLPTDQDRTHMVLASRDGKRLFTANVDSGTVSILDLAADGSATQARVATGKGVEGMDLSPDQAQLWAANAGDGTVSIIDVAQRKLVRTFDVGTKRSNRLKFTPDGKTVLISDLTAGELVVVDVASQTVRDRVKLGAGAAGILIVPDGSRAYVALTSENRLAVVELPSLRVSDRIATGRGPDGLAWIR